MLVLGRKPQQSLIIRINDMDIEVAVLHVDKENASVRLGVDAPPHVVVLRDELTRTGNGKKKQTGCAASLRSQVKAVSERRSSSTTK